MTDPLEVVRALARVVRDHDLAELEYYNEDLRIHLVQEPQDPQGVPPAERPPEPPPPSPAPAPEAPALPGVKSPLAGVFYRAPSPGAPPFVEEGDEVAAGQTLCIVEAMKLMNEITAEIPCRVKRILVENGQVVEADQDLFLVEPL